MIKKILLLLLLLLAIGISATILFIDSPSYHGPTSPHFKGDKFHNLEPGTIGVLDVMKLISEALFDKATWPDSLPVKKQVIPLNPTDTLKITFINHASVLIQVDGITILTDPVYAKRVGPLSIVGPKRIREPGVNIEDLPPIDVILVSHNHYDHLDEQSLKTIYKKQSQKPIIITGLGNDLLLKKWHIPSVALDWDQSHKHQKVTFSFIEARHRSGRGILDHDKTLWGGFVIKTSKGNLFFAGDTAYGPHFKKIKQKYGSMKLCLLPIGSYEPRWFMKMVHLNPMDAVKTHIDLDCESSVPIHYGTFQLSFEGVDEPLIKLDKALAKVKVNKETFKEMLFGQTRTFA